MKKPLILLSAIGLAGAACAQSSVTLFGIVDATLAHGSGSIANRTQLTSGGHTTSRIGFRGVEDLGGGLSAIFWLEAGLAADSGTGQATNTNNQPSGAAPAAAGGQGLTFNRRSTVGLSGPWGEVRLGRDLLPQYYALGNGDIFVNVGSGAAINYTQVITGVTSTRASNSIAYFSPSFAGFRVHAAHYFGENLSNGANSNDGTGDGIRLAYATGPFSAEVAYGRTKYQAGDSVQRNIGFQYNFGVAKVVGDFNRDRAGTLNSKGGALGMSVPVGVGEIRTGYSWHKTDAAGNPEAKKLGVGYVHNLSKRTAVYTTYARVRNSGGSAVALAGASTAGNSSSSGFDIGVRHNF